MRSRVIQQGTLLLIAAAVAAGLCSCKSKEQPAPAPRTHTRPAEKAIPRNPDDLVVRINGVSIYERDLLNGMPADAFEDETELIRTQKLRLLASLVFTEQLLRSHNISVSQKDIDDNLGWFEKRVTTDGCPDCGSGFASLEQYRQAHGFTPAALRRNVALAVGLRMYADSILKERMEPNAVAKTAREMRKELEQQYLNGSAMFFSFYNARDENERKSLMEAKQAQAQKAWQRLEANEPFDVVARSMSDHAESAARGGKLGVVSFVTLGNIVEDQWRKLEPGKYSRPISTSWYYAIVRRDNLTDADITELVTRFIPQKVDEEINAELYALRAKARYEYAGVASGGKAATGPSASSAPATTAATSPATTTAPAKLPASAPAPAQPTSRP